ncbi:TetR/AcrR family transcriptional regulator [Shewanella litorisediminis]|uniref:TetR/AcrR family transcriptional regulator n=1 Tax=Shewanella litorisediminis TaxID=1173586 RepID=A0ABX7G0C9_9GAMM|nr:TetR/AcrR family transcriptional regulator [Shewanella litorisediminis]MCL2918252.1 TetR/AcrR family transcriptional regulator [Shewanella litorisediminis]QRH00698.1 TetR/AcrR family transcriptional regulator [Shewanella litorisediminis]
MRSAEFDREQVLRQAMQAFMQKGYSKTSMQDLTRATGLHPGSIYCAFENKRGLLLAAIGQYQADRTAQFQAFFPESGSVVAGLDAYLANLVAECQCGADKGCLLTKSLNELAEQDSEISALLCKSLGSCQQGLATQFQRAMDSGEIPNTQTAMERAEYLVMGIYGLRTLAQTHPSAQTLKRLALKLRIDSCA